MTRLAGIGQKGFDQGGDAGRLLDSGERRFPPLDEIGEPVELARPVALAGGHRCAVELELQPVIKPPPARRADDMRLAARGGRGRSGWWRW